MPGAWQQAENGGSLQTLSFLPSFSPLSQAPCPEYGWLSFLLLYSQLGTLAKARLYPVLQPFNSVKILWSDHDARTVGIRKDNVGVMGLQEVTLTIV